MVRDAATGACDTGSPSSAAPAGRRTRVALLLADDAVYLPRVVAPLLADPRIELRCAALFGLAGAPSMHPGGARGAAAVVRRARVYGARGLAALAAVQAIGRARAAVGGRTLAALARRHGAAAVRWRGSVNDPRLVARVRASGSDVVLGVFSERAGDDLRAAAPGGVLLLHYSALPRFAGREPTFWTLLEDPAAGGVTFFRAEEALDAGPVAAQARCSLEGARSLHAAIARLSDAAGAIAADAACRAARGALTPQPPGDRAPRGWPDRGDVARFRARGYRFA